MENIDKSIVCGMCKNYNKDLECKAFPKGIPDDIINGENDHTEKHPDQKNDIVFEPIEDKE